MSYKLPPDVVTMAEIAKEICEPKDPETWAERIAARKQQQTTRILSLNGSLHPYELERLERYDNATEGVLRSVEERQTIIPYKGVKQ